MDLGGLKSDPYVIFTLGKQKKTSKVKLYTKNPRWNQYFRIPVESPETDVLELTVMDKDV